MLIVAAATTSSEAHSCIYGLNFMGELCAQTNAMYVHHTLYLYAPPLLQSLDLPLLIFACFCGSFFFIKEHSTNLACKHNYIASQL